MLEDLSACSVFIMCLMCKIMEADNPRDPAVDPADSCEVSTQHAIIGTKGKAQAFDSQAMLAFCNFLPLRHYKQLHIQIAACL